MRNIMLLVKKNNIEDLTPADIEQIVYCPVEENDEWKIVFAKELVELQSGSLVLPNFDTDEIQEMLTYICTS